MKLFAVFHVANVLHMSHLRVPVPELGISSSKPYRKFKSPLISLMIGTMEETNYFSCANPFPAKVVEPNIVIIKGHNFTGVYPSPVVMDLDAKNVSNYDVVYQNLNMRLFSHVSVIYTVIQNKWLATNSRNTFLNIFEDYYMYSYGLLQLLRLISQVRF